MENYEQIHRLGSGGCGSVYLVRHVTSRKLFALKKIELDERKKTRTKESVEKEAKILSQLKHPHIVSYHESFFDPEEEFLYIIQDYCDGGNMDDKIREAARKEKYFEEAQIMEWFIQIIMAVQYFHSKKVLHRDLKAENVFLTKKNLVKIGDFGISKVLESTIDVAKTVVGTPSYLSPELCQDIPYSSKSDMWAVGCLFYEMCALKPPFDAQNLISLFFKIIKAEYEPIPSHYSIELQELIQTILVKTPDDRPSASAILNMPLVKKHLALFIEKKESLLQQRGNKDDSDVSPNHQGLANRSKAQGKHLKSPLDASPVIGRNKLRISTPMIKQGEIDLKARKKESPSESKQSEKTSTIVAQTSDSGISNELVKDMLDVPKPVTDASSDYSDDFDDSSENDDVIPEEVPSDRESDIEDQCPEPDMDTTQQDTDTTDQGLTEYDDDFEEYDSSEDLDAIINQAKEAEDVEAVDDWFADSLTEMYHKQHSLLFRRQCTEALGGRDFQEVQQLVKAGTLTEEELRHDFKLRMSIGADDIEICHFNIEDLGT